MTKGKISFPTFLFSIIIVIVTWSLIEGWFPLSRRKWLFLALGMGFAGFFNNHLYRSRRFLWLCGYLLILLINMFSGDKYFNDIGTVGYEFFCLGFPAVVATFVLTNKNRKDEGMVMYSFLLVLIATTISSFFIDMFILPNAIRAMTQYSIVLNDMSTVYAYYKMGLSSYAFPHALPILIPPFVLGVKNITLSKKVRFICFITLICLVVLIYLSGIMTALLLSVAALIMAFVTKPGGLKKNLRRFVIIGIVILPLLSPTIMGSILHEAKIAVGNESYYYDKLDSFEYSITNEGAEEVGGDWGERKELYTLSKSGLVGNLIFGTNQNVGGHSSFLDRLGLLGLFGIIPFLIFFISQSRFSGNCLPKQSRLYYYEGLFMGILMLSLKSSLQVETMVVLFAVLPITTSYLSNDNIKRM